MALACDQQAPPYHLDPRPLGHGGCAKVTRGTHRDTGTVAAVKQAFDHPQMLARLQREIEVQSQIEHPNVMPVIEYNTKYLWYSMPLASTDLAGLRQRHGVTPDDLVRIVDDVWNGLEAAHRLGHVHRDITPRNILLVDDHWVISDFGLVTKGDRDSLLTLTRTGAAIGTAGFVAPEVVHDPRSASPASDAYSLGIVASWAMTGSWPREGALVALPKDPTWAEFVRATCGTDPSERLDIGDMGVGPKKGPRLGGLVPGAQRVYQLRKPPRVLRRRRLLP